MFQPSIKRMENLIHYLLTVMRSITLLSPDSSHIRTVFCKSKVQSIAAHLFQGTAEIEHSVLIVCYLRRSDRMPCYWRGVSPSQSKSLRTIAGDLCKEVSLMRSVRLWWCTGVLLTVIIGYSFYFNIPDSVGANQVDRQLEQVIQRKDPGEIHKIATFRDKGKYSVQYTEQFLKSLSKAARFRSFSGEGAATWPDGRTVLSFTTQINDQRFITYIIEDRQTLFHKVFPKWTLCGVISPI